ncbi:MAG: GNAT family N-acetyltransferase [Gemmatimonadaceae bacterium]
MTADFSVRHATLGDLGSIVELRLSLLREYRDHPMYGHLRPDAGPRAEELFRAQLMSPNETMFVAQSAGRLIGVMRCADTPVSPLLFPEHYCFVSSVYVRPDDRRRGVLRALLAAAESWCAERGIDEMRLNNVTESVAAHAWESLGFGVVEHVRRRALPPSAKSPTRPQTVAN